MNFYTIVCVLWVVCFVLFIGVVLIAFSVPSKKAAYPGQRNQCPDFWTGDALGNCHFPIAPSFVDKNVKINVGKLTSLAADANAAPYSKDGKSFNVNDVLWASGGESTACAQRTWAIKNRIVWDGVSNFNQCT